VLMLLQRRLGDLSGRLQDVNHNFGQGNPWLSRFVHWASVRRKTTLVPNILEMHQAAVVIPHWHLESVIVSVFRFPLFVEHSEDNLTKSETSRSVCRGYRLEFQSSPKQELRSSLWWKRHWSLGLIQCVCTFSHWQLLDVR
jgi:hypothetical protein